MAHKTWHNYGYGICTDDLEVWSVKALEKLLSRAPIYQERVRTALANEGILNPTIDDYLENLPDDHGHYGLATLLAEVIKEREGIHFEAVDNYNTECFLILMPEYPWSPLAKSRKYRNLTKEKVEAVLMKYVKIITHDIPDVDYQEAENGG